MTGASLASTDVPGLVVDLVPGADGSVVATTLLDQLVILDENWNVSDDFRSQADVVGAGPGHTLIGALGSRLVLLDVDRVMPKRRSTSCGKISRSEWRARKVMMSMLALVTISSPMSSGQPVTTDRILVHVWGHRGGGDRQLLKQLVHRFRHKIGDDSEQPRWLETVPNVGYRLRG